MNRLLKQAFTLIELLVVIAIIGILSGLIVVSMGGMTTKATIAKAQVFSNSLRNSLMMNLVSDWNFDGSGVLDNSAVNASYLVDMWKGENGTVTAAPPTVLSGSNCISGSCLNFNGSQYVSIPYDPVFNFGTQMTAMVWVKALGQTGKGIFGQYDYNSTPKQYSWLIYTSNNKIAVDLSSNGTDYNARTSSIDAPFDGNWHLVGFTWNSGTFLMYIDGKSVSFTSGGTTLTNSLWNSISNLTLGCFLSNNSPVYYFNGQVDEARLYNLAISTSQIKEQYYAGLNNLLAKGGLTKEEYSMKIKGVSFTD